MLTRFFLQSKPIQFILLIAYLSFCHLAYFIIHAEQIAIKDSFYNLLLVVFSAILVNFIVKKNKLQDQNSYTLLFFCFLCSINQLVFNSFYDALGLVFMLLAIRRLISLKSQIQISKKLFDAGFWCFWASVCHNSHWVLLFVILFGVLFYAADNFKHFMLGFLGFICAGVIYLSASLILFDAVPNYQDLLPQYTFSFDTVLSIQQLVNLYALLLLGVLVLFFISSIYRPLKLDQQRSLSLLIILLFVYSLQSFFTASFTSANYLYIGLGLAFLGGNVMQVKNLKLIFKEIILWVFIILSLVQFSLA